MNTNLTHHFHLSIGEKVQGEYTPKAINLAFIFQVNCPGCFIYGISTLNMLYEKYQQDIGILGISTAFEDFDKNTLANTRLLIETQGLTGETKKYFARKGLNQYPQKVLFPVFFDHQSSPKQFLSDLNLDIIQQKLTPSINTTTPEVQADFRQRLIAHYERFPQISHTFSLNQLPGTPTLVIYNQQCEIIHLKFGQQSPELIDTWLSDLLASHLYSTS